MVVAGRSALRLNGDVGENVFNPAFDISDEENIAFNAKDALGRWFLHDFILTWLSTG